METLVALYFPVRDKNGWEEKKNKTEMPNRSSVSWIQNDNLIAIVVCVVAIYKISPRTTNYIR